MSNDSSSVKNKIVFNGKEMELNTLSGTVGPSVVDIRSLYSDLGIFTYDPGYGSTGSCESGITYIDGEKGILLHRGYPIDQLAEKSSFLEVAYLLLNGDLPKKPEKKEFETKEFSDYKDQFQWFLAIAFALLFLDAILFEKRTAWIKKMDLFKERKES